MPRPPALALAAFTTLVGLASFTASSCGSDPDTPTPTIKTYPRDAIDDVATTETLHLAAANEPIRIVRDTRGMVHVYGRSLHDVAVGQGYMAARDRAPQLEILRRAAEGRLAAYAGRFQQSLAGRDIFLRAMGFRRTADLYYASLADGSDVKAAVDGYAAGVTAYFRTIRDGSASVPNGWLAIPRDKYTDWEPQSSLALARLLTWQLSYTGGDEIDFSELVDAVRTTFRADATDPALAARAGLPFDAVRFEPAAKVPVVPSPVSGGAAPADRRRRKAAPVNGPQIDAQIIADVRPMIDAERDVKDFLGKGDWSSNNWVVGPGHSATGHAMVASDPHLGLPAPAVFHMVGLHVAGGANGTAADPEKGLDVAGMSFAGTPGVVLGFNQNIAWGATVAVFDVNDVYLDHVVDGKVTMKQADGTTSQVAIVPITEQLDYGDGRLQPITIETIPGHGVILPTVKDNRFAPREGSQVLAIRWTGFEPTGELAAFLGLDRARDVDEARKALESFEVGAQNFVIGDSSGNIAYTTHSLVPLRPAAARAWDAKTFKGQLPCLVLPGDAGLEWTGRLDPALLPQAKNPASGFIATANSDQYGMVFDNDPSNDAFYLGCLWDPGFRKARVDERLHLKIDAGATLSLDDLASIQADAKSPLGSKIARHFAAAIRRAEAARTGGKAAPDLAAVLADKRYDGARLSFVASLFDTWASESDFDAASGAVVDGDPTPSAREIAASQATLVFNAAMSPLFKYAFDDELRAMQTTRESQGKSGPPVWRKDLQWKGLIRMLDKPAPLATADAAGESVLWDDLSTKDVVESKDDRLLRAMLDALEYLETTLGNDPSTWRWGNVHTIRFATMLSGTDAQLSIPGTGDTRFPAGGFPRHGDEQVIDRSDWGLGGADHGYNFSYGNGPAQRMVAELTPGGPVVRNALPGGNVWIPGSPHFADEAELWRLNRNKPVFYAPGEVVPHAEERIDLLP